MPCLMDQNPEVHMALCWVWCRSSYRHLERQRKRFFFSSGSMQVPHDSHGQLFLERHPCKTFPLMAALFQRVYVTESAQLQFSLVETANNRGVLFQPLLSGNNHFSFRSQANPVMCLAFLPAFTLVSFTQVDESVFWSVRKKIMLPGFLGWASELTRKVKPKERSWAVGTFSGLLPEE